MKEIGKILKEKREKKKITFAQAHAATKIQEKYLAALEEGNSKVFFAPVYYKSFLKSYSKYLGLDQELLLKKYEESNSSADARERYDYERNGEFFIKEIYEDKENAADGETEKEFSAKSIDAKYVVAAVLAAAFLLGVFFYLNGKMSDGAFEPEAQTSAGGAGVQAAGVQTQKEPPELKAEDAESGKKEFVKTEVPKLNAAGSQDLKTQSFQKQETSAPEVLAAQTPLELGIQAVENVWVKVDSDGREQFQGTLLKNNSRVFKADKEFSLRIGYTPGIKVFFNDKPIDVQSGSVQDVNAIVLKREDK
jgi:cytoskeletal protein RodZ